MRIQFSASVSVSVLTSLAALMALPAAAQTYPSKPIRILIAQAPGSATDNVSRVLTAKLAGQMGQQFIIEARPGAGGAVGTEAAARAPADGYTLFMANNSTHGSNPAVYKKLPYDAIKDFSPIILIASTPYVLTAHPSLPVKNVKELVALAKKRPGDLNYGSAGNGSTHHLSGELLNMMAGIKLIHVPYKGAGPAVTDLLGGRLNLMFENLPTIIPHVRSGKLRLLAVGTKQRSALAPEFPTIAEEGVPGYDSATVFGVLAPAKTSPAIITRLNKEMVTALRAPEAKASLASRGLEAVGSTPQEYAAQIKDEFVRYGRIAKAAGIRLD